MHAVSCAAQDLQEAGWHARESISSDTSPLGMHHQGGQSWHPCVAESPADCLQCFLLARDGDLNLGAESQMSNCG